MKFLIVLLFPLIVLIGCDSGEPTSSSQILLSLDTTFLHTLSRVSIRLSGVFERDEYGQPDTSSILFFDNGDANTGLQLSLKQLKWNGSHFSCYDSSHYYSPPWKYGGAVIKDIVGAVEGTINERSQIECSVRYTYVSTESGRREQRISFNTIPAITKSDVHLDFISSPGMPRSCITDFFVAQNSSTTDRQICWDDPPQLLVHFYK